MRKFFIPVAIFAVVVLIGFAIRWQDSNERGRRGPGQVAPVEVAAIRKGEIREYRTFSGTLEANAQFMIAPKVSGRVEELFANIADPVQRGQIIARMDSAEFEQDVAQAEAELAVAQANLVEAESALEIAQRELDRIRTLRERGVASESQFDSTRAEVAARQGQVAVAEAQLTRSRSALESARIRLGYTRIAADWNRGDDERLVARRFVDEGANVSANQPLLEIVELDPITGAFSVTEREYSRLRAGQPARITTDAFPGETFVGTIARIAPVFAETSRQARVEVEIENADHRLKPGMFMRATVEIDRASQATIVPFAALTRRDDVQGIFIVGSDGESVVWQPVETGIRSGSDIQLLDDTLSGRVVTLGQQLIDEGSTISIVEEYEEPAGSPVTRAGA